MELKFWNFGFCFEKPRLYKGFVLKDLHNVRCTLILYELYFYRFSYFVRRRINTCVMARIFSTKMARTVLKTGNYIGGMTYRHPLVIRTATSNKV